MHSGGDVSRTGHLRWDELYAAALSDGRGLSGFYHRNVRVGDHLVRVPITDAPQMDLRIWPEPAVLESVARYVPGAPRLRYATSACATYQVHDWIDGQVLDEVAPQGTAVPAGVISACAQLFGQLARVPADELPPLPQDWPADGDCAGFAARLLRLTRDIHTRLADSYHRLWRDLDIPDDPFAALRFDQLSPRPFQLLHCDVHRKNILLEPREDGLTCRFLDWELACFGDPVYDLAVHLHKMGYLPEEQDAACRAWQCACHADRWPWWQHDLRVYREHERVKSVIVDSVRYAQLAATAPAQHQARVVNLTAKLAAARQVWGQRSPVKQEHVCAALRASAQRRSPT